MFAALSPSVVRPSESDHAVQNELLTGTLPEQTSTLPTTTQMKLASEASPATRNAQAVQAWLAKIERKARRDKTAFWGFFVFFQMFIVLPIALINTFPITRNGHLNLVMLAMLCLPALGLAALALRIALKKSDWNAEEMTRVGGVQAVGALLELLNTPKRPGQVKPLFVALIRLLPQMKASDAELLTAGQRDVLYTLLKSGLTTYSEPDLLLACRLVVLNALEQIGDADAVPVVEHLAHGKARTAHQKALKAAAIECLPQLLVKFGGVEANQTLLRASSPENALHETLLRPVGFTPDAAREQLLQSADKTHRP